jgi:catechol 2,3-dioxygenase-like lactoylglutathione lyase family enzyme
MLDHLGFAVRDHARSKAFYTQALAPLGITLLMEFGPHAGYGKDGKAFFWITGARLETWRPEHTPGGAPIHLCFSSPDRKSVDAFYQAAIAAGGVDNGPPGIRALYHPNYYGAFVLDPDGNNIEAACHHPE